MLVGDTLMSPSVALLAEAPELAARCIPRYALSVARNAKCPLSLEKAGQCIVVNATARIGQAVDSDSL